jgi:8-oxo-dGTP pyrophosphatase MutT (NUDIX family)
MHSEVQIFVDDYRIVFSTKPANNSQSIQLLSQSIHATEVLQRIQDVQKDVHYLCSNIHESLALFLVDLEVQRAGGGLVKNEFGEYLVIFRRGRWDLPKGKLDLGETIEACALREVEEETGVTALTLGAYITETYHAYKHRNQWIIKHTSWYHMTAKKIALIPQVEEDITLAEWRDPILLKDCLSNTYANIEIVLQHAS